MRRPYTLCALLVAFSLGCVGLAQVDPRAKALLEGLEEGIAPQPATLETADTTSCYTFYEDGKAQPETCIRIVMDLLNRRLYNESRTLYEGEPANTKLVYQNGRATFTDSISEELFEVPKAQLESLEKMFAQVFEQLSGPVAPDYQNATYDGRVRYGDVLVGEQVTVKTTIPSVTAGLQPSLKQVETTARYIFDPEGRALGGTAEVPTQGTLLQVYTDPEDPVPYRRYANGTMYTVKGERITLFSKTRVTRYRVNELLNEALFRLEPAPKPKRP